MILKLLAIKLITLFIRKISMVVMTSKSVKFLIFFFIKTPSFFNTSQMKYATENIYIYYSRTYEDIQMKFRGK